MYKKKTIRKLAGFFIFLLVLVVIVLLIDQKKGKRTFRTDLFEADTADVTAIIIRTKADRDNPITLEKMKSGWQLKSKNRQFNAEEGIVQEILRTLNDLQATRVAATDKSKWKEFEVDDSSATKILVKKDKKLVSTLYLGKFSYQVPKNSNPYDYYNQQPKISTYVRVGDEKQVYVVEGFLSMLFNRGFNNYRNQAIIRSNSSDWFRLTFSYPADSSFVLTKEKELWAIGGVPVDSVRTAEYLKSIASVSSENFVDDQKPVSGKPDFTLKIEGNNRMNPIILSAFATDSTHGYLISSSENEGAYFSGKQSNLLNRIFIGKIRFFSTGK
jgi:Domain of unknown function (DUF4340)